jgi:hypothetical protein
LVEELKLLVAGEAWRVAAMGVVAELKQLLK